MEKQQSRSLVQRPSLRDLIGESTAMREISELIERVADKRASVLISGESGTGKELVARALHFASMRAEAPFVALNCAALPENLVESELFGIVKGVATGVDAKPGRFEDAHGGTLFLDEIGDLSLASQAKILRVLQERVIEPLGGRKTIRVEVRIVAATNRELKQEIAQGNFREDLYYRLRVIPIQIPPLRERPEDIPPLVDFFLWKHSDGVRRSVSPAALEALCACQWRGNVRELENVIECALALSRAAELGAEDFYCLPDDEKVGNRHPDPTAQNSTEPFARSSLAIPISPCGYNDQAWAEFLAEWYAIYREHPTTVKTLLSDRDGGCCSLLEGSDFPAEISEALEYEYPRSAKRIGCALAGVELQKYINAGNGFQVVRAEKKDRGAIRWSVQRFSL